MGQYREAEVPTIVKGDGCYVIDQHGNRYLDGLAGLFAVQIGYGHGAAVAEAASAQLRELPYFSGFGWANPASAALAAKIASLTPGDLNRVHFVNGGGEAVDTAWKLARQYFAIKGERRFKVISRDLAYHGCTFGALSITGYHGMKDPFEPLVPGVVHCLSTDRFRRPEGESEAEFTRFLLDDMERAIYRAGPETVAMVIVEPVQNGGGAFTPPAGYLSGVRQLCDEYGILLCLDEVITGYGRLGEWFGAIRYGVLPDLITNAKGMSSAYASIGAVVAREHVFEPFLGQDKMFLHGMTFAGHPVQAAIALKNLEIIENEGIIDHVRSAEPAFRASLTQLLELDIVGDVRGAGFKMAVELVRDPETLDRFTPEENERVFYGYIAPELLKRGLICRSDTRAGNVLQFCPPLIADRPEFDQIASTVRDVLDGAWKLVRGA